MGENINVSHPNDIVKSTRLAVFLHTRSLPRVRFFRAPRPFFEDFFYCLCSFFWQCCPLQIKYISFAGILIEFVLSDFPIRLFQFGGFISHFYAALLRFKFVGFCRPFFNYFGFSLILKGFIVRQEINSLSMFIYWFGYSIFFFTNSYYSCYSTCNRLLCPA